MKFKVTTKFDGDQLKRAMEAAAQAGLNQRGTEMQEALDVLSDAYRGKPVDVVYAALKDKEAQRGWGWKEVHLRGFAAGIAEGRRVHIEVQRVRL